MFDFQKMLGGFKKMFYDILHDKKKLIIAIAVVAVIVVILIPKNKKTETTGIGNDVSSVMNADVYSCTGTVDFCDKETNISLNKSSGNYQLSVNFENKDYTSLLTKYNNTFYYNYSLLSESAGLATVKEDTVEGQVSMTDFIVTLLNSQQFEYSAGDGYTQAKINTQEQWSALCEEAVSLLSANTIYTSSEGQAFITYLSDILTKASASAGTNSLVLTFTPNDNGGQLTIDAELSYDAVPEFIDEEYFDSNVFTVYAILDFVLVDNTVSVPQGYVYTMNTGVEEFISDVWSSMFTKGDYTSMSEITTTADSVQNIIDLGSTKETYQYKFNDDGVSKAVLIVSSREKDVINNYISYVGLSAETSQTVFDDETKMYSVSFTLGSNALSSLNKISTTPSGLAAYFKTAEGVVPIV